MDSAVALGCIWITAGLIVGVLIGKIINNRRE